MVGPLDRDFGIDRFVVVRGGREEAPGLGSTGRRPARDHRRRAGRDRGLRRPSSSPRARTRTSTSATPAPARRSRSATRSTGRLRLLGRWRAAARPSRTTPLASLQPSAEPAPPSFAPVAPGATPSTGLLAAGRDRDRPGARRLARSPRPRLERPLLRSPARLPSGLDGRTGEAPPRGRRDREPEDRRIVPEGFIPGAHHRRRQLRRPVRPQPGHASAGHAGRQPDDHARHGAGLRVPRDDRLGGPRRRRSRHRRRPARRGGRRTGCDSRSSRTSRARGPRSRVAPRHRSRPSDPAATPTTGTARLGEPVVLAADGGTMPVVVDGVDQVAAVHRRRARAAGRGLHRGRA